MKKKISLAVIMILLLSSITVFGGEGSIVPYASGQINAYSIVTSSSGTTLNVTADVEGTVPNLTKIGFNSITIYEKNSSGAWVAVKTEYQLFSYNSGYHKATISFAGKWGKQYYAAAYVYAEDNSGGSTSRTITSAVYTL